MELLARRVGGVDGGRPAVPEGEQAGDRLL